MRIKCRVKIGAGIKEYKFQGRLTPPWCISLAWVSRVLQLSPCRRQKVESHLKIMNVVGPNVSDAGLVARRNEPLREDASHFLTLDGQSRSSAALPRPPGLLSPPRDGTQDKFVIAVVCLRRAELAL